MSTWRHVPWRLLFGAFIHQHCGIFRNGADICASHFGKFLIFCYILLPVFHRSSQNNDKSPDFEVFSADLIFKFEFQMFDICDYDGLPRPVGK